VTKCEEELRGLKQQVDKEMNFSMGVQTNLEQERNVTS